MFTSPRQQALKQRTSAHHQLLQIISFTDHTLCLKKRANLKTV